MDFVVSTPHLILTFTLTILHSLLLGECTTFTFVNKCSATVWPGILSNAGSTPLQTTGFELPSGTARALSVPAGWSGRFWARTGCLFDALGHGSCATGDCGSGEMQCKGAGAAPPATLAEFTLNGSGGKDFYDVSLVDGYNLPMVVEAGAGGEEGCAPTGCAADLNLRCPAELKVGDGEAAACRSACEAFGRPEYCCSGEFGSPATCRPTVYSEMFKSACPRSYSYAYDDASSIFTCAGAQEYTITFCPATSPSQKATTSPSPPTATGATTTAWGGDSWLASLANGGANGASRKIGTCSSSVLLTVLLMTTILISFPL